MIKILLVIVITVASLFCNEINLEVNNITPNCNVLKIGLYNSKESFSLVDKSHKGVDLKTNHQTLKYTFENIPNGTYAIALFCDENKNGCLDTNFVGIPKEAYGFSNNPKVFGKPSFDDAKFELQNSKNLIIGVQK